MTPKQIENFAKKAHDSEIVCYDSMHLPNVDTCQGEFLFYRIEEACYISCKKHFDVFINQHNKIVYKIYNFSEKDIFYLRLLLK